MTKKTHTATCHCGAMKIVADIDLAESTGRCNCSYCAKTRAWGVVVTPDAVQAVDGEAGAADYQFGSKIVHHLFCKTCGVAPYGKGFLEVLGGDFYSVNVACIDGLTDDELACLPVAYANGRDNAWQNAPAVTSHL